MKDYEKASIVQLLKDKELFDSVCIAKPYSPTLVREFYANMKMGINDIQHHMHELVFVKGDTFDFSPVLISSILCTKVVRSFKTKKLDLGLDMNMVTKELTGNLMLVWLELNILTSALLTTKYVILHKITVANWMPRLHITTISKDLAVLLYAVGTNVPFDMANMVFQAIVGYAESKSTLGGLPFPFLIHEILNVQKEGFVDGDDLDMVRKPLSISTKVYTGTHVQDVGNEDADIDPDNPVTDSVATSSSVASMNIMDIMTSELTKICQRRIEIVKQI